MLYDERTMFTMTGRYSLVDKPHVWLATHEPRSYSEDFFSHWAHMPAKAPIEGTVTDPATAAASQLATGEPKARNTEGTL